MAKNYWLAGSGQQDWNVTSNWSLGAAPVSTDDVYILQGDSDIQLNVAGHSAVLLASLTIGGNFQGTIASDAVAQTAAPLAIGVATGGVVTINCLSQRIWLDFGTSQPAINVLQTGAAQSAGVGAEAVQIRGCSSAATISVTGSSSVGVCTTVPGLTSTLTSWSIEGGQLTIGDGTTWTNGYHSGGVANVYTGGTLIQQSGSGPTLNTFGTGKIATLNITGTAIINNRPPSGTDAWDTLNLGPGATGDVSTDPRPLTITTMITMQAKSTFKAFRPAQVQVNGGGAFTLKTILCSIADVTIDPGSNVLATFFNY